MDLKNILITIFCLIAYGSGIWTFIAQKTFEHKLNKRLTSFTKIFSEQVDTIKEFYRLIVIAEKALYQLMSEIEPTDNQMKKEFLANTLQPINNMVQYFEENELLFESNTVVIVKQIFEKIKKAKELQINAAFLESDRGSKAWENAVENKQNFFDNDLKNCFPVLREKLKKDFQSKYKLIST